MATKKPGTRKSKGKQPYLPEMGPVRNDRVHPRAELYIRRMRERCAATKLETEAKEELIASMKEEGLDFYELADEKVFLNPGDMKVKVVEKKEVDADAEGA